MGARTRRYFGHLIATSMVLVGVVGLLFSSGVVGGAGSVGASAVALAREPRSPTLAEPPRPSRSEPGRVVDSSSREAGRRPRPVGPVRDEPSGPRIWDGSGYRLAVVRPGEGTAVRDAPNGRVLAAIGPTTEFGSPRVMGVLERRDDWLKVTLPAFLDNRPVWVRADPGSLSYSTTDVSLHADLATRTLIYKVGDQVTAELAMAIGKPGTATPTGRFAVTDILRVADGNLNPVYGCCAVVLSALQDELPASWAGGNRIALHGTGGGVGDAVSLGCMRLSAEDIAWLAANVPLGTPVFVS